MQAPLRLLNAFRTGTPTGLVLATAVSTAVFVATPVTLPAVVDRFDVSAGTAGLYSTAQLGVFVVGSWASGRFLTPSAAVFRRALVLLAAANLASAATDLFAVLVVTRAAAGLALGVLTWLAWSQVFGDNERQGDIAVIGPLAGVVASPLFGVLLEAGDDRHVFVALAAASLLPLLAVPFFDPGGGVEQVTERHRAVPQAMVLVAALAVLTFGGSAVFVFAGVIATSELGLTPIVIALVFSANAAASIPSARWRGARPASGVWVLVTGVCAISLGSLDQAWQFWAVLTVWGFSFWAAVPGIYTLLAERSAYPAERAGDAQAAMAGGRAVGPLIGGMVVNAGSFAWLGAVGGGVMLAAGAACLLVEFGGAVRRAGAPASPTTT
ncbi:MAG: MFS transporter [Actinobacteria bacterium]|nr:MFS transporter [Actinomycetota bacterium]NIT95605.1 MFS transporter [Actinomycetota bacterium]NIU19298.1 MFS transporter [Actinomycetota bacterium]NIU66451.1 MFS transporter [Actinomycetota bacterium]NIV55784.1 hypothetical protein [Actinomycetota bacterium]